MCEDAPVWTLALALACPARADGRDALPALRVERAIAVPRGWWLLTLDATRTTPRRSGPWSAAAPDLGPRTTGSAELRFGVAPRVELYAELGAAWQGPAFGPSDPAFGARLTLLRREPPNTSIVAELGYRAGYGAAPRGIPVDGGLSELRAGLAAARQLGPTRFTAGLGATWRPPASVGWLPHLEGRIDAGDGADAAVEALVQLGPLAPWAGFHGERVGATRVVRDASREPAAGADWLADATVGLGIQLTRGVAVDVAHGWPVAGGAPLDPGAPRGPGSTLAVELAL